MVQSFEQEMIQNGSLHLAEYNPRKMSPTEMDKLVHSLREFGFVQPVVARRSDGLVIGGHQRLVALRHILHADEVSEQDAAAWPVPVVLVDLDDAHARALNLALNKISGEWDYEKLGEVLASLRTDTFDLFAMTGFDASEIADIAALTAGLDMAVAPTDVAQLDAEIDAIACRLVVQFETRGDFDACMKVLRSHGMTGARDAADALAAVCAKATACGRETSTKSAARRKSAAARNTKRKGKLTHADDDHAKT
jgi:ParB-like chromosome segregation protein Spo0J